MEVGEVFFLLKYIYIYIYIYIRRTLGNRLVSLSGPFYFLNIEMRTCSEVVIAGVIRESIFFFGRVFKIQLHRI